MLWMILTDDPLRSGLSASTNSKNFNWGRLLVGLVYSVLTLVLYCYGSCSIITIKNQSTLLDKMLNSCFMFLRLKKEGDCRHHWRRWQDTTLTDRLSKTSPTSLPLSSIKPFPSLLATKISANGQDILSFLPPSRCFTAAFFTTKWHKKYDTPGEFAMSSPRNVILEESRLTCFPTPSWKSQEILFFLSEKHFNSGDFN